MDDLTDTRQISRLEIVDTGRRRRWSAAEKLRIIEESFGSAAGIGDGASAWDFQPAPVRPALASGVWLAVRGASGTRFSALQARRVGQSVMLRDFNAVG